MVNVVVAGATGGIGRSIVDALEADGKHKIIIFTRKIPDDLRFQSPIIAVNYDDVDALQAVLEEYRIDTVISALAMHFIGVGKSQINLIKAAEKAGATKRFVASNWAARPSTEHLAQLHYGFQHIDSYAELDNTGLEWTAFNVGWFIEYYAMPHAETYISPATFVVDVANKQASIPGDGKQAMTFTYTKDIAKFVVAALDLSRWERDTYVIGDKMTWEEFVKVAEEARGEKFTVTHDSVEMLRSGKTTELPGQVAAYSSDFSRELTQELYSVFGLWVTEDVFDFPDHKALNHRFLGIKLTTVKDMLDMAWRWIVDTMTDSSHEMTLIKHHPAAAIYWYLNSL